MQNIQIIRRSFSSSINRHQILKNENLETLKLSLLKTINEAKPHIQATKENQIKILNKKFLQFNDWYLKITGLDKVNLAQEKVSDLQGQLLKIQEKRRDVQRQLSGVRQRSMDLQDEIHKVKRQEDLEKYLDLMKTETEILKLEKSVSNTFQEYDHAERELFTAFTDSIRDSHEKQRAQMEYTKYFSIILSITGSFLAFMYSTLKKEQLKKIIDERLEAIDPNAKNELFINNLLDSNQKVLNEMHKTRKEMLSFKEDIFSKLQISQVSISNNDDILPNNVEKNYLKFLDNSYIRVTIVACGLYVLSKILI